ncbi:MAG: hypothetical protein P1U70_21920 [Saprospiraceae bacterium]|jgi:cell division protein YceG involved in septum cleavage|nr:hypothetical protein [Saprospiraceae bacterium]
MPDDPNDLELIDRYLLHQLTEEEEMIFEERMKDADFQKELKIHKEMKPIKKLPEGTALESIVENLEARMLKENQSPLRPFQMILLRK